MITSVENDRIREVYDRANVLLDELGLKWYNQSLRAIGYKVAFNRRARALGFCQPVEKIISFSEKWVREHGMSIMEDVIRHEIAHALDYLDGGYARNGRGWDYHGRKWKKWAVRSGADPNRLYEGDETVTGKYTATCTVCDHTMSIHRWTRRNYWCYKCWKKDGSRQNTVVRETATGQVMLQPGILSQSNTVTNFHTALHAAGQIAAPVKVPKVIQTSKYTGMCERCNKTYPFHRKVTRSYRCKCGGPVTITQNR